MPHSQASLAPCLHPRRILRPTLLLIVLLGSPISYGQTDLRSPWLEGHWRFDEGSGSLATDASGHARHGTLQGPSWSTHAPDEADGSPTALAFDGIDDRVDLGDLALVANAFTVACWFRADHFAVVDGRLLSKATGIQEHEHFWMLSPMSSGSHIRLRFRLRTGGSTATLLAGSGNLQPGVWVHAAATYDGATLRLYKDGALVGSLARTGALDAGVGVPVAIGNQPAGAGVRPFAGRIDHVVIASRAFSAAEVQALADGLNQAPVSAPDAYTATSDQELVVATAQGVLANDQDPDLDALSAVLEADPQHGVLSLAPDGSFAYLPDPGFAGLDGFSYRALDGALLSAITPVTIAVTALADCNGNGIPDAEDLATGSSADCNGNGVPDECDLAAGTSQDRDDDGVPDECQALAGHWRFDEGSAGSALDSSPHARHGVLQGPQWTLLTADGSPFALHFDGVDDAVHLGSLDVTGSELTLSAWFRLDSFGVMDARVISKARGVNDPDHYWMLSTLKVGAAHRLRFRLQAGGTTATLIAGTGNLQLGTWTHVAATYDGAVMRLYKDGVLIGTLNKTGAIATNPSVHAAIGNQPPGTEGRPFHGIIDDVRLYERALSQAEILALIEEETPPTARDDVYAALEDTPLFVNAVDGVLANDSDALGVPLDAQLVTDVAHGTLALASDGSFTYMPAPDFQGTDWFLYVATNGRLASTAARVTLHVAAFDDCDGDGLHDAEGIDLGSSVDCNGNGVPDACDLADGADSDCNGNGVPDACDIANGTSFDDDDNAIPDECETGPDPTAPGSMWNFNDGGGSIALDASGNAHHGQVSGAQWVSQTADGSPFALRFDGIDDAVHLGPLEAIGDALTIAAWIRLDSFGVMDARVISKASGVNDPDHYWMLSTLKVGSVHRLRFRLQAGGSTATLVAGTGNLQLAVWTHVAATYDGAVMRLYKDGLLVGSSNKTGAIATHPSVHAAIGNQPAGTAGRPFHGLIDDVRLLPAALGAAEIQALATPFTPPPPPPPPPPEPGEPPATEDLVAHYPFDEGSGSATANLLGGPGGQLFGPAWSATSIDDGSTSLLFDGVNDFVNLGGLDLPPSAMTISMWMRANHFNVTDARLISKATGVNEPDHYWMLSTIPHGGQIRLRLRLKTTGGTSTLIGTAGSLATGTWTHVAATYDGVTMRLYQDGLLVGSAFKSGPIVAAPSLPVAVGNQPPGAEQRPFAGHLDDLRIYGRALGLTELQALARIPVTGPTGLPPQFTLWYGQPQPDGSNLQRFGHLGLPQTWVNVLGNASDPDSQVISLGYRLNGGPVRPLGMGPDTRRLLSPGDFNVDLLYTELLPLPQLNTVVITAEDQTGNLAQQTVRIAYQQGVFGPGSYTVNWDAAPDLQDVAQVVDGHFALQNGRIRSLTTGYDRIIAIGDIAHSNYEVRVPVIVYSIDNGGFPFPSGGPLVGLGLRWRGHVDAAVVNPSFFGPGPDQPEWGFFPAGGYAWFHWTSQGNPTTGRFEVVQNYFEGASTFAEPFVFGATYIFKARVTTVNNRPRLQFKRWRPAVQSEPPTWLITRDGNVGDPTHGSVLLIAHHVIAEFGDVVVTQLP